MRRIFNDSKLFENADETAINNAIKKRTMKNALPLFVTVLLELTAIIPLSAQEAILSGGGVNIGSGYAQSYSVGQIAYTAYSSNDGKIFQGFQSSYQIMVVTGIQRTDIRLELSAYPNPTTDLLNVMVEEGSTDELSYWLFNLEGRLVKSDLLTGRNTNIEMHHLPESTYILQIAGPDKILKSFKIIKE